MSKKNIYELIKKQIDVQNRAHLNVDVSSAKVKSIGKSVDQTVSPQGQTITPEWTRGSYILDRGDANVFKDMSYTPDLFLNYSGNIAWEINRSRVLSYVNLSAHSNNLLGIRVYSNRAQGITTTINAQHGRLIIYAKTDDSSDYRVVAEYNEVVNRTITIPIRTGIWNNLIVLFYSYVSGSSITLSFDYDNIQSWEHIDVTAPSVPQWNATPIQYTVVDGNIARGKNVLRWKKDVNIDFAGNGIYRRSYVDSGQVLTGVIPATFLHTTIGYGDELKKWHLASNGQSINSGDTISFSSDLSTGTSYISTVVITPTNEVSNPYFDSGLTNYIYDGYTTKTDIGARCGKTYLDLHYRGTAASFYVFSTMIAVSTLSNYRFGLFHSENLLSNRQYNINGYNSQPSLWDISAGINSAVATKNNLNNYVIINRSKDGGYLQTYGTPFYVSAAASYQVSCVASFISEDGYKVSIHEYGGATIASSATLFVTNRFTFDSFYFTPSVSASAFVRINVPATTSLTSFATLLFGEIGIKQINNSALMTTRCQLRFYDSLKAPCATEQFSCYLDTNSEESLSTYSIETGQFPVDCAYVRVGAYAEVLSASTIIDLRQNLYLAFFTSSDSNIPLCLYNSNYFVFRTAGTTSFARSNSGESIYFRKMEHIADRVRRADDGAVVTWDDFDIQNYTLYSYFLDAYDNSVFKNRSEFSSIATITTGDTISPKAPNPYTLEGAKGGIVHYWTTPTAVDFSKVVVYSDVGLTSQLFEYRSDPSVSIMYTESITSTAMASRWIVAYDAYGNVSASVVATCTPLGAETAIPQFSIRIKTTSYADAIPNESGWYNYTVVASLIYDGSTPLSTYYYSVAHPAFPNYTAWAAFGGSLRIAADNPWRVRFKVSDTSGVESSIKTERIWIDTAGPSWSSADKVWDTNSRGVEQANIILWNSGYTSDGLYGSGIDSFNVYRSLIHPLNGNPYFTDGDNNETPFSWQKYGTNCHASIYFSSYYNERGAAQLAIDSTSVNGGIKTSSFKIKNGDSIYLSGRARGSISGGTLSLGLYYTRTGATVVAKQINSFTTTTYWRYFGTIYNYSGAATWAILKWKLVDNAGAGAANYVLFDETIAYKNPSFELVSSPAASSGRFVDSGISGGAYYAYYLIPVDNAGNTGARSSFKTQHTKTSYRDLYSNIFDNSSFEKIDTDSNEKVTANGWNNWWWSNGIKASSVVTMQIIGGDAYHGSYALGGRFSAANPKLVSQQDIVVLPYIGKTRKYIMSFYGRSTKDSSYQIYYYIEGYNNEHHSVKVKSSNVTLSSVWARYSATFWVAVPSLTNMGVRYAAINSGGAATMWLDAVQLEEKEGTTPSEYYDTKSITADYLQGNLIRGHMIEADSITANHIKAASITATELAANSVTADKIRVNTITATQIKLNSVNVFKIEHNGYEWGGATLWKNARCCYAPSSFPNSIEHPYSVYVAGLVEGSGSNQSYLVITPLDYSLSNQGIVFYNSVGDYQIYHGRGSATLSGFSSGNYTYAGEVLLGIHHYGNGSLFVVRGSNAEYGIGGQSHTYLQINGIDTALNGVTARAAIVATMNKASYGFTDPVEPYISLSKSEMINGTIYVSYVNYDAANVRASKMYIRGYKRNGNVAVAPSMIFGSLQLGGTHKIRQTIMSYNPDTSNIFVGVIKDATATVVYKTISPVDFSNVIAVASSNAFGGYDGRMSVHGGDAIVVSGSLVHWMFTGDASSAHSYCMTDMEGNIVVSPNMKWRLPGNYSTYVWAFATNCPTYGQPPIKNERGLRLANGDFMFYMNAANARHPFDYSYWGYPFRAGTATLPSITTGLWVHKNVQYAYGSLSLMDIFNRLR